MAIMSHLLVLWAILDAALAAQDLVYVTDLAIYNSLSAVSWNVQGATLNDCPEPVSELQSCVCSKNNNFAVIGNDISSSVSYNCGGETATDDFASASTVFNAYCNQASSIAFPTPTSPVSLYITDFSAYNDLAPCAATAISSGVLWMVSIEKHSLSLTSFWRVSNPVPREQTLDKCPEDPDLLATCACEKNQNSLYVSQQINSGINYACDSHEADQSSAQALFSAYCALNDGTSSFPTTSNPPGKMSYYINDMDQYQSLVPCAQSAVSYGVFAQTYDYCPEVPEALASCVCIKDQMSALVSAELVSSVKYDCGNAATEDVDSALSVYDYYCSAARGEVTPASITPTASLPAQTSGPSPSSGNGLTTGPIQTGASSFGSSPTSGSSGSSSPTGSGGQGQGFRNSGGNSSGSSDIGAIVGGVVGGVLGAMIIGGAIFWWWWRSKQLQARALAAAQQPTTVMEVGGGAPGAGTGGGGNGELDGKAITGAAAVSPASSTVAAAPSRAENVSPVSQTTRSADPSELQGQHAQAPPPRPQMQELQGGAGVQAASAQATRTPEALSRHDHHQAMAREAQGNPIYETYGQSARSEAPQGTTIHEAHSQTLNEAQSTSIYEAHGQARSEVQGSTITLQQQNSMQTGPYHEMDAGYRGA